MSSFHVAIHDQQMVVGFHIAQLGHPLGRLPVLHLAVPVARGDQCVRVILGDDVVVGAVLHDVVEVSLVFGVAPLVKLSGGQRNALVQHGVDHVHEWHRRNDPVEQAWRHVHDCTHQEATRTPSHGVHVVVAGELLVDHGLAAVDVVVEGVHFVEQFAVFVPVPSHFASSTDVRHCIHKTAVQQAQTRHREARVHAGAVAAVCVQQEGVLPIALGAFSIDNADGDHGPISRFDHQAFAHVVGRIKRAAEHLLLLELGDFSRIEVVFEHGTGGCHGGVPVAQARGIEIGVGTDPCGVGGVVERDVLVLGTVPADESDLGQAILAFVHHKPMVEDFDSFQQHIVSVSQHVLPMLVGGGLGGSLDQLEILRVAVGHDVEVIAVVAYAVLQVPFTRLQHFPFPIGVIGVEEAVLCADCGVAGDHEVGLAFGLANPARKRFIFFLINQHVFTDICT